MDFAYGTEKAESQKKSVATFRQSCCSRVVNSPEWQGKSPITHKHQEGSEAHRTGYAPSARRCDSLGGNHVELGSGTVFAKKMSGLKSTGRVVRYPPGLAHGALYIFACSHGAVASRPPRHDGRGRAACP